MKTLTKLLALALLPAFCYGTLFYNENGSPDYERINLERCCQMQWISVDDRLPEIIPETNYSEEILTYCTLTDGEKYFSLDRLVKYNDGEINFMKNTMWGNVTHWMPLPPPPHNGQ